MAMTKRDFLRSIGAVAGVGAAYHTMSAMGLLGPVMAQAAAPELPIGSGYGKRVVILGAGISGMTAAYELSKAGYNCTILEATSRAGGRNLTVRGGDVIREIDNRQWVDFDQEDHLYANMGPARIPYHHRAILGYCKEFGVELEVFTNDNRGALFHNAEAFGGAPVTGRQVMTDLRGYVAELLAKAVNRNALDEELTGDDKEQVLAMLTAFGGLDPDHLYAGSNRSGYQGEQINAGIAPGDVNDPLDFSELLKSDFWQYKLHFSQFLNQNPTLFQPVGGMDAIAKAFRARVGHLIQFQSVVEEIRKTPEGVRIVYANQRRSLQEAIEADLRDLHNSGAGAEGHSQRLRTRDPGRNRVNRVRARGQDRVPGSAALLGRGSRHLRRDFVDGPGHHANLVSVERLPPAQGRHHGRLHLGRPARPGPALHPDDAAGTAANRDGGRRANPSRIHGRDRVRRKPRLVERPVPKGRLAAEL